MSSIGCYQQRQNFLNDRPRLTRLLLPRTIVVIFMACDSQGQVLLHERMSLPALHIPYTNDAQASDEEK